MSDTERLFVSLEARIADFEKKFIAAERRGEQTYQKLRRSSSSATRAMESDMVRSATRINQALETTSSRIGAYGRGLLGLGGLVGGIGAALGARELMRLADTWSELSARVTNAAGSQEQGVEVMGRLTEMARRTYSGIEQTTESWLRNATALRELGYTTEQQLDLTEAINNALVISATKGERAASVVNAWGKAMALGKLSGDNLNTVIQSGGRLAEALAASMGVSTNQLRKLGSEGKITTREMFGVTKELEKLREEADAMPATLSDAFQIMRDALLQYVGGADQAHGVSRRLAEAVILVADNFDQVADAGVKLGFVIASALVARGLGSMLAIIPSAIAGLAALTAGLSAGTLTAAGFSAALGPIGLAAGAAAAALWLLHDSNTEAESAADTHEAALRVLTHEIENVDYANADAVASTRTKIAADIEAAKVALTRARAERELAAAIPREYVDPSMSLLPAPGASDVENTVANDPMVKDRQALIDTIEVQVKELEAAQADFEAYASGERTPPSVRDRATLPPPPAGDGGSKKKRGRGGSRERKDEFEREVEQITKRTAALQAATAAQAGINPLLDDYGYAVARASAEQELLQAAQEAGVAVTPALRAQIEALADAYATAEAAAKQLDESQADIVRNAEEAAQLRRETIGGFAKDLLAGADVADALTDALGRVADRMLDMALDNIFEPQAGGQGLFAGFRGLLGFSRGTANTGGSRGEVRGVVHGQEAVIPLPDGRGVPVQFQGGRQAETSSVVLSYAPVIDARGADQAAIARLEAQMREQAAGFERTIRDRVMTAIADPRYRGRG